MSKYVYFFGSGKAEGDAGMKSLLGGKGANLAEMNNLGLPVPPGFTITTDACHRYYLHGRKWPRGLASEIDKNLKKLEKYTGKTFGGSKNPLLVSVRSGAAVSMPGMMDTVLNLGLNPKSMKAMTEQTGNPRFVWDAYRRLIQMFGDVVMGVEKHRFEHEIEEVKRGFAKRNRVRGAGKLVQEALNKEVPDTALGVDDLKEVVARFKRVYRKSTGEAFPEDPRVQLRRAIDAVFGSWNNPRAIKYREINDIRGLLGTAVNVQTMVFGNAGESCATGVAFTRDPSTGEHRYFYGEYLVNAQGEDVVAGTRTPQQITVKGSREWAKSQGVSEKERRAKYPSLEEVMPGCFRRLDRIRVKLEKHYRDMQDIEFTIEDGSLYMLQTRNGKRTTAAAVKIATDLVKEKLITEKDAVLRIDPDSLDQLLHPVFIAAAEKKAKKLAVGLPASPGAATGQVVFDADEAERWAADGKSVILCRIETSPEDIGGMNVAKGILTARGGMTSHAAVVARGMGTCCVAGCGDLKINYKSQSFSVKGTRFGKGAWISLNGSTGTVYAGEIDTVVPKLTGPFGEVMKLADKYRRLGVRTNSDTPHDTEVAVKFGAEGIGLTRTEHMFFEGDRIVSFRRLILVADRVKSLRKEIAQAEGKEKKELEKRLKAPLAQYNRALKELLPLQRKDFTGIFKALKGRPCTIRLLDPPLHEFLPQDTQGQKEMAKAMGVNVGEIRELVEALHESNPMLGHRGCRLGLTYPEVSDMQVRAIIEAAIDVKRKSRTPVKPEIMIPLVGNAEELRIARERAEAEIARVFKEKRLRKGDLDYKIGTMIEVPRAAVTADEVARYADFFSFGTNDLTQMGCGFSRDDAGKFLGDYVEMGIYDYDPFQVLDQDGVGRLIEIAVKLGRSMNPGLKIGICGEHGGEPRSVEFCDRVGLDYVSCSPYRVPIARLAAAQAVLKKGKK